MTVRNRVELYSMENPYEREFAYATLGEEGLQVWAITSEKAPGDRYGYMYEVAPGDLPRLLAACGVEEDGLLGALKQRYSYGFAEKDFLEFCKQNDIPYKTYLAG